MPKISKLKEIDGEIWACVGSASSFPSGIALWTPEEQEQNYLAGMREALRNLEDFYNERVQNAS